MQSNLFLTSSHGAPTTSEGKTFYRIIVLTLRIFLPRSRFSVLQRVLQFPVVNSALSSLQRMYASAKEIHPLMASICATYERALQNASSLALWSVKPVVHKLDPLFCDSISE
uniref:Perilipin 1 n=1 Tax=Pseudonaja textilis TaxID=8673 RepID=A0A670Y958_PSETE